MGGSNFSRAYTTFSSPGRSYHAARHPHTFPVRISGFFFPVYGFGFGYGGSSLLSIALMGFVAYSLFTALKRMRNDEDYESDSEFATERASVCKVQVGLLGLARSLQSDLDSIARRVDTSTPSGLHYLLQGRFLSIHFLIWPLRNVIGVESES